MRPLLSSFIFHTVSFSFWVNGLRNMVKTLCLFHGIMVLNLSFFPLFFSMKILLTNLTNLLKVNTLNIISIYIYTTFVFLLLSLIYCLLLISGTFGHKSSQRLSAFGVNCFERLECASWFFGFEWDMFFVVLSQVAKVHHKGNRNYLSVQTWKWDFRLWKGSRERNQDGKCKLKVI